MSEQNGMQSTWAPTRSSLAHPELTKRELFAAMAMQGVLSSSAAITSQDLVIAKVAVRYADALLAELAKPKEAK